MAKGKKNEDQLPKATRDEDTEYPETVMFPPLSPGQDQKKRQPAVVDKPGSRSGVGRQAEEYPATVMFPPKGPGGYVVDDGGYPETVMFPPGGPGGHVDDDGGYPETVMFPPQGPGGYVDDDGGYPETVMFPPRGPGGHVDDDGGYPETVMFPPRGPGGRADDGYPETVQFPPKRPAQPVDDAYPETVQFPPRRPGPAPNSRPVQQFPPAGPRPQQFNVQRPTTAGVVPGTPVQFPTPQPLLPGNPWSTGLFDCDQDSTNMVMTTIFPCITFGQVADILDQGNTSCALGALMYALLMPILSCALVGTTYRARLRHAYNLVQAPGEDWLLHLLCPCCALCQEYRELQHRGFDPSLGWIGNLARQQATTPPGMTPMRR